jgi:hypothetical protein
MKLKIGSVYRHYKGKTYTILHIARNAAHGHTPEELSVIYQENYICHQYGKNCVWSCPYAEFCDIINAIPRFSHI